MVKKFKLPENKIDTLNELKKNVAQNGVPVVDDGKFIDHFILIDRLVFLAPCVLINWLNFP